MKVRLAALCVLLTSCGSSAGSRVQLPFRAGGASAGPLTFVTPSGWTVTLTEARIAVGPFYFNASPPATNSFRNGIVLVQATEQVIVDALDPTLQDLAGGADGESGHAVAVEIGLLPPDTSHSAAESAGLGGAVGVVAGTAVKGATVVPFLGPIAIDTALVTPQTPLAALQRVKGATVNLDFENDARVLELRVDPRVWFDFCDFAPLLAGTAQNGAFTWNLHSTFQSTLVQGVKAETGTYLFDLVTP